MPDKIITLDDLKAFIEEVYVDLVKGDVGLGNVDNTSDADKPISTATQTALNAKQDTLVSGNNIKTVGGQSILGSGDLPIGGGTKLYKHVVFFSDGSGLALISTISSQFTTINSIFDYYYGTECKIFDGFYLVSKYGTGGHILGFYLNAAATTNYLQVYYITAYKSGGADSERAPTIDNKIYPNTITISSDTVTEL